MDANLFDAALERATKTWKTYTTAICILHLTLLIDALSGFSFLKGKESIDLAGFKVVREALSATYGILFALFVATTFFESRLLKSSASTVDLSTSKGLALIDLWFVSPFSSYSFLRGIFWLLFIDGFLFLAEFSFVHLASISPPDPHRMSSIHYITIGAFDFVLLVICIPFGRWTYGNFQQVRSTLPGR